MRGEVIRRAHRHALVALAALMMVLSWSSRAEAACTISAAGINFGAYSVFSATPDDATGTVTINCTNADNNVSLTLSSGSSGTYTARTMKKGAEGRSRYNIFAEASRTTIFGDGTSGSVYFLQRSSW